MKLVQNPTPAAILLASLLFVSFGATAYGQSAAIPQNTSAANAGGKEETLQLEALTVTTSTRTARAVDHIPGAVVAIPSQDLIKIQLSSLDPNQMLAQAIPGYTASLDDLTTSGELLRGKR